MEELRNLRKADKDVDSDSDGADDREDVEDGSVGSIVKQNRGVWSNRIEFFLAIMGYTVGIGSVWRFPIICSRNGGGAFLIPYFLSLLVIGGPLYYLEVCVGQFTGRSAGLAFECCPLLKGIGLLQVVLAAAVSWYVSLVLAWCLYFLYWSFFPTLPWMTCDNDWNTEHCVVESTSWNVTANDTGVDTLASNFTYVLNTTVAAVTQGDGRHSAAHEFWEYKVEGRSAGFHEPGTLQPHLVLCLFLSWVFVIAAIIKGVKTLGKVVYVTATAPYLILTVMFIRGLTLEGSADGIIFYVTPDFSKLRSLQVWVDAALQVFYSLGPGWGGVITMASYNSFHERSFWPTVACIVSSGFTSFYNGLVVFSIIGFMAHHSNQSVEELAKASGTGLTFIAFPTAIGKLPMPQLWSVLFFLTLITVVFDSIFGGLEVVSSFIIDNFPRQLVRRRVLVNICMGVAYFLLGLPLAMNCGIYMFQLGDWYFPRFGLLFGTMFECIIICWIYGLDRFSEDIALMTGRSVSLSLRIVWAFVTPVMALIGFILILVWSTLPDYGDGYGYTPLSIGLAVFIGVLPIISSFGWVIYALVKGSGSIGERVKKSLRPTERWKPNDDYAAKTYLAKEPRGPENWRKKLFGDRKWS